MTATLWILALQAYCIALIGAYMLRLKGEVEGV